MAGTLAGPVTAAGEASMKEWNLVGRSSKRSVSEKSTEDGLKLAFDSRGHRRGAVGSSVNHTHLFRGRTHQAEMFGQYL